MKIGDLVTVKAVGPHVGKIGMVLATDGADTHGVLVRFAGWNNEGHGYLDGYVRGADLKLVGAEPAAEPLGGATFSKATGPNPKDLLGTKKVSLTKFPMTALIHGAHAMMNGAAKYGPYNWRAKDVIASIYVDAACRHLAAWFEREETAEDSGVHHLGHALASIAIILDAQENGNLIDDRPSAKTAEVVKNLLDRLAKVIARRTTEAGK